MALKVQNYQQTQVARSYGSPGTPPVVDVYAGVDKGLKDVARTAEKLSLRSAELEAEEALQSFVRSSNELLLTGKDPYYGTRGKDSVNRAGDTMKALEEIKREHLGRIKHPEASRMLSKSLEARITSESARIQARALDGQKEWDQSLAETGVEQASENITLYLNDPARVRASEESIKQQMRVLFDGMPIETINERAESVVSKSIAGGIANEIKRSPGRAQAMLEQYGDRLEPQDKKKLQEGLKTHWDNQRAAAAANDIRAQNPNNLEAQLKAARQKFKGDVKLQDELKRRLTNDHSLDKQAKQNRQREIEEQLALEIEQGARYSDIAWEILDDLDSAQRNRLRALEATLTKTGKVETDPKAYAEIYARQKEWGTPGFNPLEYSGRLSTTDMKALIKEDAKIRNGEPFDSDGLIGKKVHVMNTLEGMFTDEEEVNREFAIIEGMVREFENREKRDVSRTELDKIMHDYLGRKVWVIDRTGPDTREQKTIQEIDIDDVPVAEQKEIVEALQAAGRAVSDVAITKLYKRNLLREMRRREQLSKTAVKKSDLQE